MKQENESPKNKVLDKLVKRTFKDMKDKHKFEPKIIIGTTLDEDLGILLTMDESGEKVMLQIGKESYMMNHESLLFLTKTIHAVTKIIGLEANNSFSKLMTCPEEENEKFEDRMNLFQLLGGNLKNLSKERDWAESVGKKLEEIKKEPSFSSAFDKKDKLTDEDVAEIDHVFKMSDILFSKLKEDLFKMKANGHPVTDETIAIADSIIDLNKQLSFTSFKSLSSQELKELGAKNADSAMKMVVLHKKFYDNCSREEQKDMVTVILEIMSEEGKKEKDSSDLLSKIMGSHGISMSKEEDEMTETKSIEEVSEEVPEPDYVPEPPNTEAVFAELEKENVITEETIQPVEELIEEETSSVGDFVFDESAFKKDDLMDQILYGDIPVENPGKLVEIEGEDSQSLSTKLGLETAKEPLKITFDDDDEEENLSLEDNDDTIFEDPEDGEDPEEEEEEEIEEEEEEVEDEENAGFLERMESLEGTLTGAFELHVEEEPTFEKIEKIKLEFGEFAAREYVEGLSQEQKEELVRKKIEAKSAKAAEAPTQEMSSEE